MTSKLIICHPPIPTSPDAWERLKQAYIYIVYLNICNLLSENVSNVHNNEDDPHAIDDVSYLQNTSSKCVSCHPSHPAPQWPGKRRDKFSLLDQTLNIFFPQPKPPPNGPNSEEAPGEPCVMTCSIIRTHHPMSPAAIHPVPPPNGKGKGGIYFYYYPRP